MKLSELPDRRAARNPHGPAVADARKTLTNAQLRDRVQAAANHLCDLGIPQNAVGKTDKAPLRAAHTIPAPRTIEESTQ
jgi:long-chain acyl-CoA synthetase